MNKSLVLVVLVMFSGLIATTLWITGTEPVTQATTETTPVYSTSNTIELADDLTLVEVERVDTAKSVAASPPVNETELAPQATAPTAPTPTATTPPPPVITTIDQLLTSLLPPTERARITSIDIETDGIDGTLAYVEPIAANGSTWRLVYDQADMYDASGTFVITPDVLQTIVHEYAHVLMLNNTQVTHVKSDAQYIECELSETIVDEGCAQADSYLAQFIERFWTETDREAAYDAFLAGDEEHFAYTLFTDHPTEFVSEYAATDPVEDAAESFMFFVLRPEPVSGTIANQKGTFFSQFPELIALRNYMQASLSAT